MSAPTLLTIVLNYKTAHMTRDAVAAAVVEMDGFAGEIVVVDNESRDGSFAFLSQALEDAGRGAAGRVRVVESGHNGGFGAGVNFGIRTGLRNGRAPDYVYLLNSDAVPGPGAIRRLVEHLEAHPEIGLAGSYIHGPDGAPHATAFRFPTLWSEFEGAARTGPITRLLASRVVALPVPQATCAVDWLAGASLLVRRAVLDEVGLFDERFFLYFEETDLCHRAKLNGWPTVYVRASEVSHIGSASTGMKTWRRTPRYWFESRLHYYTKHHGRAYAAAATLACLLGGAIWSARRLLDRGIRNDRPAFFGDLVTHALGALARPRTRPAPSVVPPAERGLRRPRSTP